MDLLQLSEFKSIIDLLKAFPDEQTCINHLETIRWNGIVVSPFDANSTVYKSPNNRYKCRNSNKYFNVRTGTIFEDTKLPLQKWFMALYIFSSHKKGISSHQLAKDLSITQKSAWFVLHRLRYAFDHPAFKEVMKGTVEADETYIGGLERNKHRQDKSGKMGRGTDKAPVLGMVERGGRVKTVLLDNVKGHTLTTQIFNSVETGSRVITDQFNAYYMLRARFEHERVNHSNDEFVRGDVHTNTVESYFSLLKRGILGIYHHVSKEHLQPYLDEFALRYNTREHSTSDRFNFILTNI
ncbi:MAG: IS1595 family transposase, partial [Bacteroidia bacterium]